MEQLTNQLHLFYKAPLQPQIRQHIHEHLVSTLTSPQYQNLALSSLPTLTNSDPYLLFHVLTILHHAPTTEPLFDTLLAHVPTTPRETLNKAALVTSYHGLVLWSQNPQHLFLQQVLALVYHNGHTPDAARTICAGVMLLTAAIELLSTKKKLTSAARADLRRHVRRRCNDVLSGLEIGARLAGPAFPDAVRQAAVRALAVLVTLCPDSVSDVLDVLARCVDGRYDRTGAEILSVVIDILGGRVADIRTVVAMVAAILEAIAMGGVVDNAFAGRLMTLVELVVRRCATTPALERILNALMGVTALWAGNKPGWFVGALDCWIAILGTFEDSHMRGVLVEKVYTALAKVCVERCMDNPLLAELGRGDRVMIEHDWDEVGDVAEIATDPVALSSCLFIYVGLGDPESFDSFCSRDEYVSKCVQTLLMVARLSPAVAAETSTFTITKMADRANPTDMVTAAQIAYGLAQIRCSPELLQRVYELLSAGLWKEPELGVALLRTAAALVKLLENEPEETIRRIGGDLLAISQQALTVDDHLHTLYAAAVLSLSLDASFRKLLFQNPPLPATLIMMTQYPAVAALGVSSTLHWALFPMRGKNGLPEKWGDSEWARRTTAAQEILQPVFAPCGGIAGMTRYTCLVDVAMDITYGAHAKTVSAVWCALSKRVVEVLMATVRELSDSLAGIKNADDGKEIGDALARVLRALSTVKKVHFRECEGLERIISHVLPYAEVSEMLTEACLGVVRGMVDDVRMRDDAIRLARSVVSRGGGVGELAVGVLSDAADVSFNGVLGLVEGVSSKDIGICRECLQALQNLHVSRRIFGRTEFSNIRENVVKECLAIVGLVPGRETLGEEALEVLWSIKEGGGGTVEGIVSEIGNIGNACDSKNEFGVAVKRVVDDFLVRNAQVSL